MRWLLVVAALGCGHRSIPQRKPKYDALTRDDFNRLAVRTNDPVYWVEDRNHDRHVDPDEVASLLFYPTDGAWVANGAFTHAFEAAFNRILAARREAVPGAELVPDPPGDPDGRARRALVRAELDLAPPVLIHTDLHGDAFAPHLIAAARLIDRLYDRQTGAAALLPRLPEDLESRSLFRRDHGAACVSPTYRTNPACSAVPAAQQAVDVYPAVLQRSTTFCDAFAGRRIAPYSIERGASDVPYTRAYASDMKAVGDELIAAADALHGSSETALEAYLRAAAASFASNDWAAADAAFAGITPETSQWYVRVGPDDVAWDPCKHKAGFRLTFARRDSTVYPWKPGALGAVPDPYELIIAAGYRRAPIGASPVESAGGRTIVLANLFAVPDAVALVQTPVAQVLDPSAGYHARRDADVLLAQLRATIAPASVRLTPELAPAFRDLATGVRLFTRIEELRAARVISDELASQASLAAIVAVLARMDELFDPIGARLPDAHAVGILTGMLVERGVLVWSATGAGSFAYHADRMQAAIAEIAATLTEITDRDDIAAATALAARYADEQFVPYGVIAYRFRIAARPTFVYSVSD